jgi:DNA-binding NarL/FixJ family response regulator
MDESERLTQAIASRKQILKQLEQCMTDAKILAPIVEKLLAEAAEHVKALTSDFTMTQKVEVGERTLTYSRMDESEKQAVVADFQGGKSASQIARERGRSVMTITSCLKKAGVVAETNAGRGLHRNTEVKQMQNRILRMM